MALRDPSAVPSMIRFIDERADEQLQYVIELSQQSSYSWNKPGTDQVAAMVQERIGAAFRFHRVVEQSKVGNLRLLSNVPLGEKSICFIAHMDAVFPPEHPFRERWVDGDELQVLEHFGLASYGTADLEYIHLLAQALYIGVTDEYVPDWMQVSKAHAARRVREIDVEPALPTPDRRPDGEDGAQASALRWPVRPWDSSTPTATT